MESQENKKDKAIVESVGEALRSGDGSNTARVLLRGDSSRSQGGRATMRRLGAGADSVAPRFPVILGTKMDGVVELDLTKERAAMKSRWIAVGLYFSPLPCSNEGLFGNLKNKWGLRGHLDYKPLRNNRFLLEFEREGDRHFILDNGPWTYNGVAFLMVANDGSTPPVEVEVAYMPIWARIHDVLPIMLDEGVAWKLGATLGEILEVDTNRSGKIWGDFIRVRVKHDV